MRKVTSEIVRAFENNDHKRVGNSYTCNQRLYLHENLIAKRENGKLYITNAGWKSNTTKERLNGLDGVSINQKDFQWYLNGEKWNGEWVEVK